MEYVEVKFRTADARTYCYHNDGLPVKPGDQVKVPTRGGEPGEWTRATVDLVHHNKPKFETKAILGKLDAEDPHTRGSY